MEIKQGFNIFLSASIRDVITTTSKKGYTKIELVLEDEYINIYRVRFTKDQIASNLHEKYKSLKNKKVFLRLFQSLDIWRGNVQETYFLLHDPAIFQSVQNTVKEVAK